MGPDDEINQVIVKMGYVLATPRVQHSSFYKLIDGTIIKVVMLLNFLIPIPPKPDDYDVNTTNIVSSFVPSEKRRPELFAPTPNPQFDKDIVDDDVEFEVIKENFSVYDLTNGLVVSIKPVLGQVRKTKYYSVQGEPIYLTNVSPIVKFKKG